MGELLIPQEQRGKYCVLSYVTDTRIVSSAHATSQRVLDHTHTLVEVGVRCIVRAKAGNGLEIILQFAVRPCRRGRAAILHAIAVLRLQIVHVNVRKGVGHPVELAHQKVTGIVQTDTQALLLQLHGITACATEHKLDADV